MLIAPMIAMPPTCVVMSTSIDLSQTEFGWTEEIALRVGADETCPWIDLTRPLGVRITELKARTVLVDGTRHKLDETRQEWILRDLAGHGALRLHTPEVVKRDVIVVKMVREWPVGPYQWEAEGGTLSGALSGMASAGTLEHPGGEPKSNSWRHPDPPAQITLTYDLEVPGDPMRSLYPGGGSSVVETWTVRFPKGAAEDSAIVVPVPSNAAELVVTGTHLQRDDSAVLTNLEPGEEHTVTFELPDAPTYGQPPKIRGAEITMAVSAANGIVKWQDDETWWLAGVDMAPLLPDRPRLIRALDNRFHRAAIPEPGLPNFLRGEPTGPALIAQLRPALMRRAGIGDLPIDPLFPRRLVKARRSGALSSVEAALTLWLQAGQAQHTATWAIVRPANTGQGFHTSPAGYTKGLTAIRFGERVEWIDPGCRVCAPFELRPELEGADMLSPLGYRSPAPAPGKYAVIDEDGTRTIELEGPAALLTRIRFAAMPPDMLEGAIPSFFGGKGATLVGTEGLAEPGQPIRLQIALPDEPSDPFDPAFLQDDGWWAWAGERSWQREGEGSRRHVHQPSLCWTQRAVEGGGVVETLSVAERVIAAESTAKLFTARAEPAEVESEGHEH